MFNSKFLDFIGNEVRTKKGQTLGLISFHKKWNKHIFEPINDTFYDTRCLLDLAKELRKRDIEEKWKKKNQ